MVLLGRCIPLLAGCTGLGQDLGRPAGFRAAVSYMLMAPLVLLLPF
jgi:hypothetical protein